MTQITNNISTKKSIDPGIVRSSITGDNHNS